jgi:hypothetical protein
MFGILVGALFFGNPVIALMVGVGSVIPDLDRDTVFSAKRLFDADKIHRALFHNFLFIGIVYLINPFFGIGALPAFISRFIYYNKGPRRRMALSIHKISNKSSVRFRRQQIGTRPKT